MKLKDKIFQLTPLSIACLYLVVAFLWIFFTDQLVEYFFTDPHLISLIQTTKGWFYVIMTTLGLYYLIRKHVELNQRIEEDRLITLELQEKLFDRIPVMITIYDPDLREIRVNRAFTEITGYTNEDIATIDLMEACYPDKKYREEIAEFMAKPGSGWKEVELTTKSGEVIYNSWTNILLTDDTQVGIGINLTEIRRQEEEVRKSRQLLKDIFESLEESVLLIDPEERVILDCNEATVQMTGYSKSELIGKSTRLLHTDQNHFEQFHELGSDALEEKGVFETEFRLKTKSGTIIDTDHTVTLVRDNEGVQVVVSVVRDITDKIKTEKALRESEERYRHIFENNPEPMWIFELETHEFLEVNEAAIRKYGYSREEFLNMTINDIRPPSERSKLNNILQKKEDMSDPETEWIHQKKNGELMVVNVYGTGMMYEGRKARLILVNDITEKKKSKELMIQAAIEGEDRERRRIAQELHDGIGQYLSAVNLNLESLKKEIESFPPQKADRFKTSLSLVKKAMKDTRVLAYTLMPAELEDFGLVAALRSLANEIQGSYDMKVETSFELKEEQISSQIKRNLYRIIQESVNNAMKHGKAEVIRISLKMNGNVVRCSITDDGLGMHPDDLSQTKGLGLKSIKARVESMSGSLSIESEPGKGVRTEVHVPVQKEQRK